MTCCPAPKLRIYFCIGCVFFLGYELLFLAAFFYIVKLSIGFVVTVFIIFCIFISDKLGAYQIFYMIFDVDLSHFRIPLLCVMENQTVRTHISHTVLEDLYGHYLFINDGKQRVKPAIDLHKQKLYPTVAIDILECISNICIWSIILANLKQSIKVIGLVFGSWRKNLVIVLLKYDAVKILYNVCV